MTPEEIYDLYGEKMFQYAALRLGSSEDAEDILQETFSRLARYPIRWTIIRDVQAFAFKVLRNETNRFLRRKISRPQTDSLKADPESADSVDGTDKRSGDQSSFNLAGALAALPDEQREIVVLKIFQDLSFKEIAALCGLSINTAASRYRYGIEKLRTEIGREK